jgi:hypothetical protein
MTSYIHKENRSLKIRQRDFRKFADDIRNRGRIPVILEVSSACSVGPLIRTMYSVPQDITIGKFLEELYTDSSMRNVDRLYLYWENIYVPREVQIKKMYYKCQDTEDGFLYMKYSNRHSVGKFVANWTQRKIDWTSMKIES